MKPEQLAAERFTQHTNYAIKLVLTFPTPGITIDDYQGLWYEALYETAVKEPEKALKERLHLVMAHRYLCDDLRARNRKKRSNPLDWSSNARYESDYQQLLVALEHVDEDDDIDENDWLEEHIFTDHDIY